MNKLQASRLVNNYIANLQLNSNFIRKITEFLNNDKDKTLKNIEEDDNFCNEILRYHLQDIIKQYNDIQQYIDVKNFKFKLLKKYLFTFAQQEISNNMSTNIGDTANNLSFSSQDVDYRSAPIVIYRIFSDDKQLYQDKIWVGQPGQHHDQFLYSDNINDNCRDANGNEILACLYLYQDDIIYISNHDINNYSNLDEIVNILKEKFPTHIKGIFQVYYPNPDNDKGKTTTRLARKLY